MEPIFISYKRANKKQVFDLVKKIEDRLKVKCWVDLDGIESSAQFASTICNAIDESKVVIFMHSSAHLSIDYEEDYTIKELNYARNTHKKVILVKLDDAPLKNFFLLEFGLKNFRDVRDNDQFERLLADIRKHIGITSQDSRSKGSFVNDHSGRTEYNKPIETYEELNSRGLAYFYGRGVKQDYNEAVKWFRKAADQGCSDAYNNLGLAYYYGNGVQQDYNEAFKWFIKAADQGLPYAQSNVGLCYEYGYGVSKNFSLAESYYRKAADQGNKDAMTALKRFSY